jgi:hypothetical protein
MRLGHLRRLGAKGGRDLLGRRLASMLAICALALGVSCVSPEELRLEDGGEIHWLRISDRHPRILLIVSSERASRASTQLRRHRRHRIGDIGAGFEDRTVTIPLYDRTAQPVGDISTKRRRGERPRLPKLPQCALLATGSGSPNAATVQMAAVCSGRSGVPDRTPRTALRINYQLGA